MNYINFLKRNKNIRILTFIQFIVYFGAWFSQTGVFTLLITLNAPTWAISTSAFLAFVPGILLAPINGIIVEKNKPKNLLIITAIIEFFSIIFLVFITNLTMLYMLFILIFVRLCVAEIYFQTQMSLVAKILNKDDLKLANEIYSIIWGLSYTTGMASAGIFIYFLNIQLAFIFDGILIAFGVCLLLFLRIPTFKKRLNHKSLKMIKQGIAYIFKHKIILHLIILHAIIGITTYETLITLLAKHNYKDELSSSLIIGFLNSVRAISLVFGSFILSKIINTKRLNLFFIGQGFGLILWAFLQENFYLSCIGIMMAGFFTSSLWSYTLMLIQHYTNKEFHGRVIAYTNMLYLSVSVLVSIMTGFLFECNLGLNFITAIFGSIFIIASFYWTFFYIRYFKVAR
ncbi:MULTISPECIES: MFS transporter [unclassified Campylobacter]|uniref:MFS transporter n=1 Tax=unclassified Campylobacter TaxID=2593542 RepID=UPI001237A63A|nr:MULTISPECIES: MFS transporter [unclassified Campylobacter]KAA6226040.1 MFS transporter [Campylobacter sp. LR196d]KAA6226633.1 MFS transporter [Campylobacter sp. LR286c]KAA6227563.1 MFS transporter [Campylobacter sp. LR185c]KAA6230003.1 MFS transporter [Campylobacter sp. LR291e]KAA6230846.1 MFS transporter [Campylobacter sp. LR264d]